MVCVSTQVIEHRFELRLKGAGDTDSDLRKGIRKTGGNASEILELDQQRLRILQCTARAMATSPGGLRFKPGTRSWLEGLTPSR